MKTQKSKKNLIVQCVLGGLTIALLAYLAWKIWPIMASLTTEEGRASFQTKMTEMGATSFWVLLGLQILQVVFVVLPAEPLAIMSGMCYGTWGGTAVMIFSTFISTIVVYGLVYFLGKRFLYQVFSQEKIDKIENSKVFQNAERLEFIMFLLFFLPGTPKDLLVYIGAILPINAWKFVTISTLARIPSMISATLIGNSITGDSWTLPILIYAVTALIAVVIIWVYKKKGGKDTEELLRILK